MIVLFATVEFFEREKSVRSTLKRLFIGEGIISEKVALPENEYFYRLKVPVHKGKIPSEKLKRMTESVGDGLIFPEGFVPEKGIKIYSPSWFGDVVLFNSALKQLEESVQNPSETLVTVIDKKGVLHTEISRLINSAGEIKVITDNVRAYTGVTERLMQEYGASVFVSDKLSSIPGKGIIISPRSEVVPLYFKGLIITGEKRFFPFAKVLAGEGISNVGNYGALCPEGINMTAFISALCEVCFVKELRKSVYEKLVDISL